MIVPGIPQTTAAAHMEMTMQKTISLRIKPAVVVVVAQILEKQPSQVPTLVNNQPRHQQLNLHKLRLPRLPLGVDAGVPPHAGGGGRHKISDQFQSNRCVFDNDNYERTANNTDLNVDIYE